MVIIEARILHLKTAPLFIEECQDCPFFQEKSFTNACYLNYNLRVYATGTIHKDCPLPKGNY
jgi:hypothetical protein